MNIMTRVIAAALVVLGLAGDARAQVVSLLVGNQSNFNGIDRYAFPNGAYQGVFAGPGTGPPSFSYLTYGPDNNLYISSNIGANPVLKFNGMTGNFISTFVPSNGATFTFGTAGDFFRIDQNSSSVLRFSGSTGQLIGTFASGLLGAQAIHFGPSGDLFVNNLNSIRRFDGMTGAPLGEFVTTGSGGLTGVQDFLFTADGRLLVAGGSGGPNDKILQYDGMTGAFAGIFAQGNGLNLPTALAVGPDGNLYVAHGGNSILEFDLANGNFLGTFVSAPAHASSFHIAFTPFPVPEPTSIIYAGLVAFIAGSSRVRRFATGLIKRTSSRDRSHLNETINLREEPC